MTRDARVAGAPAEGGENIGLHRLALFTACSTAFLILVGGLVTSHDAGLSVPDWPTTYGWNMFTFPYSKWVGGIFYEHGHRLVASFVGMLTVILTVWIGFKEPRRWVKWTSVAALGAVIAQGILGGLTVRYLLPPSISTFHACLAQSFFCMTIALAMVTSRGWKRGLPAVRESGSGLRLPVVCAIATSAIFLQLMVGALMRHIPGAGLAIPDFPLAFGGLIPPFSSSKIVIHFAHRVGALIVVSAVTWAFLRVRRSARNTPLLVRPATVMFALVWVQFALGAFTVWTGTEVWVTTAHVANGALVLGSSFVLLLRAFAMVKSEAASVAYPIRERAWQ